MRNGVRSRFPPCVRAQEPAALLRAWASGVPARSLTLASGMTALFLIPLLRHPGRYTSPIAARDWQASVRARDPACGPNTNAHLNSFVSPCLRARPDIKPASHQDAEARRALQRRGSFVGQCTRRPETPPSARRLRAAHPPPRRRGGKEPGVNGFLPRFPLLTTPAPHEMRHTQQANFAVSPCLLRPLLGTFAMPHTIT